MGQRLPLAGMLPILHSSEFVGIWLATARQTVRSEATARFDAPGSRRKADAPCLQGVLKAPETD